MGDSFQGTDEISVQPKDSAVPYSFTFPACSSAIANDGAIPYGTTIASAEVSATKLDNGKNGTTALIDASSVNGDYEVIVSLNWPSGTGLGAGKYKLTFLLTLSTGAIKEFDFLRVVAENI